MAKKIYESGSIPIPPNSFLLLVKVAEILKFNENKSSILSNYEIYKLNPKNNSGAFVMTYKKGDILSGDGTPSFINNELKLWPLIDSSGKLLYNNSNFYENLNINYVVSVVKSAVDDESNADETKKGRNYYNMSEKNLKGDSEKAKYNEYYLINEGIIDVDTNDINIFYEDEIIIKMRVANAINQKTRLTTKKYYYLDDVRAYINDSGNKNKIKKFIANRPNNSNSAEALDQFIFGFFKDLKYSEEQIQYIYMPDEIKIYRGLLLFNYSMVEKKRFNFGEPIIAVVKSGDEITCDYAKEGKTKFQANKSNVLKEGVYSSGLATDNVVGVNLFPFKSCIKTSDGTCKMKLKTGAQWTNLSKSTGDSQGKVTRMSTIKCELDGTISFVPTDVQDAISFVSKNDLDFKVSSTQVHSEILDNVVEKAVETWKATTEFAKNAAKAMNDASHED